MTKFLQTLQSSLSLTDSEIELFTKEKMTELIHFIELDKKDLMEMGFLRGPANGIVAHVKSLLPKESQTLRIETESNDEKFEKLCNYFNSGKNVTKELKFYTKKVVFPNKKIDFAKTQAMLNFKGDPGNIWKGDPIVSVDNLDDSMVWLHPRDQLHLQDGFDPNTGIEWKLLGEEGMCLVVFAEESGLLKNKDDETVFEDFLNKKKLFITSTTKLIASGRNIQDYSSCVRISAKFLNKEPETKIEKALVMSGNNHKDLSNLLMSLFSTAELKRFCLYKVGDDVTNSSEFNGSSLSVVYSVTEQLRMRGYLNHTPFWINLRDERPRREKEIYTVARLFGVNV